MPDPDDESPNPSAFRLFLHFLPARPLTVLTLTLGLYLAILVPRLLWENPRDGVWTSDLHLWGDWPFHIAMIRRFAECPPWDWLSQHPMIGGEPLRYPFVSSMLSGMLMRAGLSVPAAILFPTFIEFALLLPGMYALYRLLLGGEWRPLIAIYLFFCAAGPGIVDWLQAFRLQPSAALLLNPPQDYSAAPEYEWYSSNFLSAMLLPQRAFLLGLTVAVWLLVLLLFTFTFWEALRPRLRTRLLLVSGVLGGLMPIMHMHSFFAAAVLSFSVILPFAGRSWPRWRAILFTYALPGLLLAAILYRLLLAPVHPFPHFVSWHPGLNAHDAGFREWLRMWWKFWGIALPLGLVGLLPVLRRGSWRIGFFLGGFAIFGIANLIQFQPIPWDNSKLFLWVYLCLCGLLANLLADFGRIAPWVRASLPRLGNGWPLRLLFRAVSSALCVLLSATGLLCLIRLQRVDQNKNQIVSPDDMRRADMVRRSTSPDSVFLTDGYVAQWIMTWGGRPIFLGFTGWMPNFAFDYDSREKDRIAIYAGGPTAERLLVRDRIDYVVIGSGERREFKPNQVWFDRHYPILLHDGDCTIYRIGRSDSASSAH